MKHKVMADALTMIDDALIEDSDIKGIDRQTRILRYAKRFGGLAACLVIIGGLFQKAGSAEKSAGFIKINSSRFGRILIF